MNKIEEINRLIQSLPSDVTRIDSIAPMHIPWMEAEGVDLKEKRNFQIRFMDEDDMLYKAKQWKSMGEIENFLFKNIQIRFSGKSYEFNTEHRVNIIQLATSLNIPHMKLVEYGLVEDTPPSPEIEKEDSIPTWREEDLVPSDIFSNPMYLKNE